MSDQTTVSIQFDGLQFNLQAHGWLQSNGADALEETLGRLLKKPGVKAAIALDRASGAILKTSGQISSIRTSKPQDAQGTGSFATDAATGQPSETQGAEELAAMVWTFVSTAGSLVQELDSEVRLWRYYFYGCMNMADRIAG